MMVPQTPTTAEPVSGARGGGRGIHFRVRVRVWYLGSGSQSRGQGRELTGRDPVAVAIPPHSGTPRICRRIIIILESLIVLVPAVRWEAYGYRARCWTCCSYRRKLNCMHRPAGSRHPRPAARLSCVCAYHVTVHSVWGERCGSKGGREGRRGWERWGGGCRYARLTVART